MPQYPVGPDGSQLAATFRRQFNVGKLAQSAIASVVAALVVVWVVGRD